MYFAARRDPSRQELWALDVVLQLAADFLEYGRLVRELRRRAEREQDTRSAAEAAGRRKNEFLAMLSHELRPLAAALPALEVQKRSHNPDHRQRAADIIDQQLQQLTRLIEDLTDASHVSRGTLPLRRRPFDLRTVIREALDMAAPLFEARCHRASVTLGTEPALVFADAARMKQVFSNLLPNAGTYTPPGGVIQCGLRSRMAGCRRVFATTAWGLCRARSSASFASSSVVRIRLPDTGLGIGLALVQQIVELHGGAVSAISEGKGRGSEFIVRLPIHHGAAVRCECEVGSALERRPLYEPYEWMGDQSGAGRKRARSPLTPCVAQTLS